LYLLLFSLSNIVFKVVLVTRQIPQLSHTWSWSVHGYVICHFNLWRTQSSRSSVPSPEKWGVRGNTAGGQSYVSCCRKLRIAIGVSRNFDVLET